MFVWLGFEELLSPPASSVKNLPFVASPTVLVSCILVYLTVVCASLAARAVGGQEVKRDSFFLRAFVQLHNVFLVGLSLYMCGGIVYEAVANGYTFWGNNFDPSEKRMAGMLHLFYVSKMYEFIDTVRASQAPFVRRCSTPFQMPRLQLPPMDLQKEMRCTRAGLSLQRSAFFLSAQPETSHVAAVNHKQRVGAVHHDSERKHAASQPPPCLSPSIYFHDLVRSLGRAALSCHVQALQVHGAIPLDHHLRAIDVDVLSPCT